MPNIRTLAVRRKGYAITQTLSNNYGGQSAISPDGIISDREIMLGRGSRCLH